MEGKTGWLNELTARIIREDFPWISFPSNHCLNQLAIMCGVIYFNFFDRVREPGQKSFNIYLRSFITLLVVFFTVMVCASTFILKVHFFVDWIPSVCIVLISGTTILLIKNNKLANWLYKIMINLQYSLWYLNSDQDITWGKQHCDYKKIETYSKSRIITHYVLSDFFFLISYLAIVLCIHLAIAVENLLANNTQIVNELIAAFLSLGVSLCVIISYTIWHFIDAHIKRNSI